MKFARNAFAMITITGSFYILSISIPLFAIYALFHLDEAKTAVLIILIIFIAVAAISVLAEFTAWCRRNRAALTVTLGEEELTIERIGGKKIKIKYSDIKSMKFDMGAVPLRRYSGKSAENYVEPRLELFGEKDKSLSVLTSPSLLMMYHIKKRVSHAKISHDVLPKLILPAAFTLIYLVIFIISALG